MIRTPNLSTEDKIRYRVASALQDDGSWSYFRYNKRGECVCQIDGLDIVQQLDLRQGRIKEKQFTKERSA